MAISDPIDTIHDAVDRALQTAEDNRKVIHPWVRDKTDFGRPLLVAAGVKNMAAFGKAVIGGLGIYVEGDRFGLHTGEGEYEETDRRGMRAAVAELCGHVERADDVAAGVGLADGCWIAAQGRSDEQLRQALQGFDPTVTIVQDGLRSSRGWTIATVSPVERPVPLAATLSNALSTTVCMFGVQHTVEWFGWVSANGGSTGRAFTYLGERSEILDSIGEPTPVEIDLGLGDLGGAVPNDPSVPDVVDSIDAETVRRVAAGWGVDLVAGYMA